MYWGSRFLNEIITRGNKSFQIEVCRITEFKTGHFISRWETKNEEMRAAEAKCKKACDFYNLEVCFEKIYEDYSKTSWGQTTRRCKLIANIFCDDFSLCLKNTQDLVHRHGDNFKEKIKHSEFVKIICERIWQEYIQKEIIRKKAEIRIRISNDSISDGFFETYYDTAFLMLFEKEGYKKLVGEEERDGLFLTILEFIAQKLHKQCDINDFYWYKYINTDRSNRVHSDADEYFIYFKKFAAPKKDLKEWY